MSFVNPIAEGADPWVIKSPHDGTYLWCFSEGNEAIAVSRSFSLTNVGVKHVVWRAPSSGPYSKEVWAPELSHLDSKWYIYFAASDGRNENHLAYALESNHGPFGPYELRGPLTEDYAIDMTILPFRGERFAMWSGWDEPLSDRQFLYIARMATPTRLATERIRICRNDDFDFEYTEKVGRGLNEAPQVLQFRDRTFILYSCGASWLTTYKLGLLELIGSDPLDPASWNKHSKPVFTSTNHTFGVGHSCFVEVGGDDDDDSWWHVYHAKVYERHGWERAIYVQPMQWTREGLPDFGSPVAPRELIPLPKERPEAATCDDMSANLQTRGSWSYYGHHQRMEWLQGDGVSLGKDPVEPINDYRCGEKVILQHPKLVGDFALQVNIAGSGGVLFGVSFPSVGVYGQKGYFVGLECESNMLVLEAMDGTSSRLLMKSPMPQEEKDSFRMTVSVVGPHIEISLDGDKKMMECCCEKKVEPGLVGLRVVNESCATFTEFEIRKT